MPIKSEVDFHKVLISRPHALIPAAEKKLLADSILLRI
jgi:hypothetical protein